MKDTGEVVTSTFDGTGNIILQLNGKSITDEVGGINVYGGTVTITGSGKVAYVALPVGSSGDIFIKGGSIGSLLKAGGRVVVEGGIIEGITGSSEIEYNPTSEMTC